MPTVVRNAKSEKREAKREKSDAKYPAIHYSFAFHNHFRVFCDKCITGQISNTGCLKKTLVGIAISIADKKHWSDFCTPRWVTLQHIVFT